MAGPAGRPLDLAPHRDHFGEPPEDAIFLADLDHGRVEHVRDEESAVLVGGGLEIGLRTPRSCRGGQNADAVLLAPGLRLGGDVLGARDVAKERGDGPAAGGVSTLGAAVALEGLQLAVPAELGRDRRAGRGRVGVEGVLDEGRRDGLLEPGLVGVDGSGPLDRGLALDLLGLEGVEPLGLFVGQVAVAIGGPGEDLLLLGVGGLNGGDELGDERIHEAPDRVGEFQSGWWGRLPERKGQ